MLNFVDNFLNKITMYRLALWGLTFLYLAALILSFAGVLKIVAPVGLIISLVELVAFCTVFNSLFCSFLDVPANVESIYITAYILALIITPPKDPADSKFLGFIFLVSLMVVVSKYILTIGKKHIWNPAALAVVVTAITINQTASWWIGTAVMTPFVILIGLLITKKLRRFDLVASFFAVSLVSIFVYDFLWSNISFVLALKNIFFETPILFFAFIMLTEPMTTPPTRDLIIIYGAIAGFLYAPFFHIGKIYFTPELALVTANVFSYAVGYKDRLILVLKEKIKVANDTYDFVFNSDTMPTFKSGQYLEWTLSHASPDSRGNRRFFTIASSPTESNIRIGVKFYTKASSYKNELINMQTGSKIIGAQLAGDFILPEDKTKKLVFIAGGIGITPFRSMIKYLIDINERRDIIILYSNKKPEDIAYKEIFDEAAQKLNIKTVYTVTDMTSISSWSGKTGMSTMDTIRQEIPDYMDRIYYLSGPQAMVNAFESSLKELGLKKSQIVTDYFPGFN